jgi:hypothetical protein
MSEILSKFNDMDIVLIKEIDLLPEGDVDIISLN